MDEIEIVAYDPHWPALYEAERAVLLPALGQLGVIDIAHIGSTAVPGLAAKPVIDIAATVTSLNLARERGIEALEALGYLFWPNTPDADELFFVKGRPPRAPRRTHHLHIAEPGAAFEDPLRFRNILRADAAIAQRYAALKRELAGRYRHDREAYTKAKTAFVAAILATRSARKHR